MASQVKPSIKRPKGIVLVKLNNQTVECVTIAMLAKICGIKPDTIRRYERAGTFPPANLRIPSNNPLSTKGNRLYTKELAVTIAKYFKASKQGVEMPEESKQGIKQAFVDERLKYLSKPKQ